MDWTLWGIWVGENVFIFAVWINSMVATCRVGCWCCIDDNIVEPLTVVDEEMLPEGHATSEQVIVDPNSQVQVVKLTEPEAVFTVDSTTA